MCIRDRYETVGLDDTQLGELVAELQRVVTHGVEQGGWPESTGAESVANAPAIQRAAAE